MPHTTTPEECAENLDDYEPVDVKRVVPENWNLLTPEDWWSPANPPTEESKPHVGSHMMAIFTPRVRVTSVIVVGDAEGVKESVHLAFDIQFHTGDAFTKVESADGSFLFSGYTGSKIRLPSDLSYLSVMRVFLLNPNSKRNYRLVFNGCEEIGE